MPKVTYRQVDGNEQTIEVPLGWSLMEAAVQKDIAGIVAECGGGCACATCHVYIDGEKAAALPAIGDMEGDMLECTAAGRRPESRLSCQIKMTEELDGLIVEIPDRQT
jgi:ferredoxin, 2Fe-2S